MVQSGGNIQDKYPASHNTVLKYVRLCSDGTVMGDIQDEYSTSYNTILEYVGLCSVTLWELLEEKDNLLV
jgi:hypothetical protein